MRNPLPYLRFRRKATSRHGVHSPFIYKLLEDVIYKKKERINSNLSKTRKKEFLLYLRLFKHFNIQTAFILQSDAFFEQVFNEYKVNNPNFKVEQQIPSFRNDISFDVFVLNNIQDQNIVKEFMNSSIINNDSFVIIPQIRASKQQLEFWKDFTNKDFTKVSLEFYHFGLAFFRKECSRQYFSIKF